MPKRLNDMSEEELRNEVKNLKIELLECKEKLATVLEPDKFVVEHAPDDFTDKAEFEAQLDFGVIARVDQYIDCGTVYAIRLSDSRVDYEKDRITAQAKAMIHGRPTRR